MKFRFLAGLVAASGIALGCVVAVAAPPQVQVIGPTDLFQDVVGGNAQVGNVYASALQLAGYGSSLPNTASALIGGDATTNLWQRATTGASQTTTYAYGGPDRWAYWSGTATAVTVSRDSTAADLPPQAYAYAFKMARTSGQTGVIQTCMAQEVESANSYQFQGSTAEFDFYATAGANFSAASSALTAYIITGTGTDEGMQKLAWGLNAGGGGSTAWTGQANAAADVATISTVSGRFAAIGSIPVTATEIGVAICFTPVGTAGTNDYVALAGMQLVRNTSLASIASQTVASSCGTGSGQISCTSFDRRQQGLETLLQERYFFKLTETAAIAPVAPCAAIDTTHTNCLVQFPVPMRIAPTGTFANGFATPTSTTQATLGACTTLAAAATVTSTVNSTLTALVNCTATTVPAAGVASFLYSNNGSGTISESAEL